MIIESLKIFSIDSKCLPPMTLVDNAASDSPVFIQLS